MHGHPGPRREEQYERVTAPVCNEESTGCAKSRQDQAFGQKLLQQPASTRTDSEPDGHLMPSRERLDQQEIADVGAGDQQDKNDHDEHDFESGEQSARIVEWRLP